MALGLCCEWVENTKGTLKNLLVSKKLQYGKFKKGEYTQTTIKQCYITNLTNLLDMLPTINNSGIKFFRISSSMFPLFDKVEPKLYDNTETKTLLERIGKYILDNKMRVTTHPGQFIVLSSDDPNIVNNSIKEMNFHGWMFDCMNLPQTPYYSINIHGGKSNRQSSLINGINRLNISAKNRMTLENDEFCYSIKDLEPISIATNVPLVYDSHHHSFNDANLTGDKALEIAMKTWREIKPTTHLSNSCEQYRNPESPITKKRIHSDFIDYFPQHQLDMYNAGKIDIEVEAKAKNLAIFNILNKFKLTLAN